MRKKLVVMLMALGLFLATATAHASLIDLEIFTTKVQSKLYNTPSFNGYTDESWHTTIGSESIFGFYNPSLAIEDVSGDSFTIDLHTRFGPGDTNTHGTQLGDMFFIVGNAMYAFDLTGYPNGGAAPFYSGVTASLSTEIFPLQTTASAYAYGQRFRGIDDSDTYEMNSIVKVDTYTGVNNSATVSRSPSDLINNSPYTYTITGNFNLFEALGLTSYGQTFDVIWAPTCANSVLWARGTLTADLPGGNVVPEPGTIALLGLGLVGLVWGRKRFFRK